MAETEQPQEPKKPNFSLSIWPPTQKTRDVVIDRLAENLSAPSILSKSYISIPTTEASATARLIEEEAFSVASATATGAAGIEVLQVYAREISKRVLAAVKAKDPASGSDNAVRSEEFSPFKI